MLSMGTLTGQKPIVPFQMVQFHYYLVTVDTAMQYYSVLIYPEFYAQSQLRSLSQNFDCLATAFVNILRVRRHIICLLCMF